MRNGRGRNLEGVKCPIPLSKSSTEFLKFLSLKQAYFVCTFYNCIAFKYGKVCLVTYSTNWTLISDLVIIFVYISILHG